jgi:hypothetical protein
MTNTEWQPIETAPYDKLVFVLYDGKHIGTLFFQKGYEKHSTITHWLPIPELPIK